VDLDSQDIPKLGPRATTGLLNDTAAAVNG
jgi:hypothetical protein